MIAAIGVLLLGFLVGELPGSPLAHAATSAVRVLPSFVTVRPRDAVTVQPLATTSVDLDAAQNEFESFQIAIEAGEVPIRRLRAKMAHPLKGSAGAIAVSNVAFFRAAYYRVRTRSDLEGSRGRWPDALIPARDAFFGERRKAFPVNVPAGENRVVWVDIYVPASQPAGRYEGSITVDAASGLEGSPLQIPITLGVFDLKLPSTPSLGTAYAMDAHLPCRAHFKTNFCDANKEAHWALYTAYVRAAIENRVTIATPTPSWPEGDAPEKYFQKFTLPLIKGEESAYTDPASGRSSISRHLADARLDTIFVMAWCLAAQDAGCIDAWKAQSELHGFAERMLFYACDEPLEKYAAIDDQEDWTDCKDRMAQVRSVWPSLRTMVTATYRHAETADALTSIDLLSPLVNFMHNKPSNPFAGNQRRTYDEFLRQDSNNELWLYDSCMSHTCDASGGRDEYFRGWPSHAIDQPPLEHRALPWLAFTYEASGLLYYETVKSLKTAWSHQHVFGGNGDGTLFYPGTPGRIGGTTDIPIESIRLKRMRDGIEDYEYLAELQARGYGDEASQVAETIFPTTYSTDAKPSSFAAARSELVRLLEATTPGL